MRFFPWGNLVEQTEAKDTTSPCWRLHSTILMFCLNMLEKLGGSALAAARAQTWQKPDNDTVLLRRGNLGSTWRRCDRKGKTLASPLQPALKFWCNLTSFPCLLLTCHVWNNSSFPLLFYKRACCIPRGGPFTVSHLQTSTQAPCLYSYQYFHLHSSVGYLYHSLFC